jgi:hypothetical protein
MTIIKVWKASKNGPIQVAGSFTERGALEKARKEAGGKNPRFVRTADGKIGYRGHWFVYVDEADAKLIDAINSRYSRYPA